MPTQPPLAGLSDPARDVDLLLVGGLTVDRFADGSSAPGGTVLHGARAASAQGISVGVVTAAGEEPEALAGLRELSRLAVVQHATVGSSIAFLHDEHDGQRTLTLLRGGVALRRLPPLDLRPRSVLYAPVADELGADLAGQVFDGAFGAAILQGWVRRLVLGRPVTPVGIATLPATLVGRLRTLELLVASTEDLARLAAQPAEQLSALRSVVGRHPILALTLGRSGALVEDADGERLMVPSLDAPPAVSTNGAGDAFAAILTARLGQGRPLRDAAQAATAAAAAYIAMRSSRAEG
jgi:sugar/nucleoside kinase (ribokinase family)